jgi:hypothetical protein
VRDVEGMGKAGGWYVLGLGWIIDHEQRVHVYACKESVGEEGALVFDRKGKGKARERQDVEPARRESPSPASTVTSLSPTDTNGDSSSGISASTIESGLVQTPICEPAETKSRPSSKEETMKRIVGRCASPLMLA